ncbi:hypothetical protein DENSPDRAFT_855727, partial [Dentipellis sp. KUC8613]
MPTFEQGDYYVRLAVHLLKDETNPHMTVRSSFLYPFLYLVTHFTEQWETMCCQTCLYRNMFSISSPTHNGRWCTKCSQWFHIKCCKPYADILGANQEYLKDDTPMDENAITLPDLLRIPIERKFTKKHSPFSIEKVLCAAHQWRENNYAVPDDFLDRVINMADANPDPDTVLAAVKKVVRDTRNKGVKCSRVFVLHIRAYPIDDSDDNDIGSSPSGQYQQDVVAEAMRLVALVEPTVTDTRSSPLPSSSPSTSSLRSPSPQMTQLAYQLLHRSSPPDSVVSETTESSQSVKHFLYSPFRLRKPPPSVTYHSISSIPSSETNDSRQSDTEDQEDWAHSTEPWTTERIERHQRRAEHYMLPAIDPRPRDIASGHYLSGYWMVWSTAVQNLDCLAPKEWLSFDVIEFYLLYQWYSHSAGAQ